MRSSNVTLFQVGEKTFPCHRSVLAATIPYFRSMFSSEMKESRQKQIEIRDISSAAFEQILSYVYTATLNFTANNVHQLLYAACILRVIADFLNLRDYTWKRQFERFLVGLGL